MISDASASPRREDVFSLAAVVAVDSRWGIGKNGGLLFRLKPDLQHFRKLTEGGAVIVGRKTLATFPRKMPLKNRLNIVLSRSDLNFAPDCDAAAVKSVAGAFDVLRQRGRNSAFVIGGQSVYREFLPLCQKAFVTKIDADGSADAFFPNLDIDPRWSLVREICAACEGELRLTICEYERTSAATF